MHDTNAIQKGKAIHEKIDFLIEFVIEMHEYWLNYINILTLNGLPQSFRSWFCNTFTEIPDEDFLIGAALTTWRK